MLKVSKLNAKDTTLDEIHAIQEANYEKQKEWTFEQLQNHYHRLIEEISKEVKSETRIITSDDLMTKPRV